MYLNQNSPIVQNMFGVPNSGTPNNYSPELISSTEAANMANLRPIAQPQYNYTNQVQQQYGYNQPQMGYVYPQQQLNYGYQQPVYYQQPQYNNPTTRYQQEFVQPQMQQQFSGYGMQPMQNQYGTLGYNPGVNQGVQFVNGGYPQYGIRQQAPQPVQQQPRSYTVEGYKPLGSKMMFSSQDLDRLNDTMRRMSEEQEEYQQRMGSIGPGYNYYGMMNFGYNPYITHKYNQEVQMIEQEAIQRQIDFNKMMSRVAHRFLGEEIDDEYLSNVYDDRQVEIPATNLEAISLANRLNSFTIDIGSMNANRCIEANRRISYEFHDQYIDPNSNLIDYLSNAGMLNAMSMQYEADAQRRDRKRTYDTKGFGQQISKELLKRDSRIPLLSNFPTLAASSRILDDGTLEISAPSWMTNGKKESEKSYQEDRDKFINMIYNNPRNRG